jgi:hypothetical protein
LVRAFARRSIPLLLLAIALIVIAGRAGDASRAGARTPAGDATRSIAHRHRTLSHPKPKATLREPADARWLATWGASMQPPTTADPVAEASFVHATLREVVFSSVGGS